MKFSALLLLATSVSAIQLNQFQTLEKRVGNGAIARVLFELLDADNSTTIERSEVEGFFDSEPEVLEIFDSIAGDDGQVCKRELKKYLKSVRGKPGKEEQDETTAEWK